MKKGEIVVQFSIGQNVIHPTHGPGEVIGIEQMDIIEEFRRYYVIEFIAKRLTLHIPVRKVEEMKVREVMSRSKLEQVMATLRQMPSQLPEHFKARRQKVEPMIQSGYPTKIAEAVRELTWREKNARLNKIDSQLLSQGRDMLINEIAVATNREIGQVREQINEALAQAIEAKQQNLETVLV